MRSLFVGIVAHKKFEFQHSENYFPIFVGENSQKLKEKYNGEAFSDQDGENISELNPYYSELTAQYWMYKNIINVDLKGLVHYRRFFVNNDGSILTGTNIKNILINNDIIVDKKVYSKYDIYKTYKIHHDIHDMDRVRNVISEECSEYLDSFDKIMTRHGYHSLNMLITKSELFDEYSEWLFNILFKVGDLVANKSDDYQKRVYGFLSERLLDVWIDKNQLTIYEINVINTEQKELEKKYENLKQKIYTILFKQ